MTDFDYLHYQSVIDNFVDNPIGALPDTVVFTGR